MNRGVAFERGVRDGGGRADPVQTDQAGGETCPTAECAATGESCRQRARQGVESRCVHKPSIPAGPG